MWWNFVGRSQPDIERPGRTGRKGPASVRCTATTEADCPPPKLRRWPLENRGDGCVDLRLCSLEGVTVRRACRAPRPERPRGHGCVSCIVLGGVRLLRLQM